MFAEIQRVLSEHRHDEDFVQVLERVKNELIVCELKQAEECEQKKDLIETVVDWCDENPLLRTVFFDLENKCKFEFVSKEDVEYGCFLTRDVELTFDDQVLAMRYDGDDEGSGPLRFVFGKWIDWKSHSGDIEQKIDMDGLSRYFRSLNAPKELTCDLFVENLFQIVKSVHCHWTSAEEAKFGSLPKSQKRKRDEE